MATEEPENAEEIKGSLDHYPLQREFISSIRLYFQHWMWQRQLGYLVHPSIPIREGSRIADVACGTGVWLLDVAKQNPLACVDGFDISQAQFPHIAWVPRNVTFSTLDILKPIPEHLREKYDVIHAGLLVLVVEDDSPLQLFDNLLTMLKPGGYIQWDESDFGGIYLKSPNEQVSHTALSELRHKVHQVLMASKKTNFNWVRHLDMSFRARNINILDNKTLPVDDDIALPWTLQHLMATTELINILDRPLGAASDWWELYQRVVMEVRGGATMRMAMMSIVGQKPHGEKVNSERWSTVSKLHL